MSSCHLCAVEFVGGPFDGYIHLASFPPDELSGMVSLPVNENMFRLLEGKARGPKQRATSVAVYELVERGGAWRYLHLGATGAEQFQLQQWQG